MARTLRLYSRGFNKDEATHYIFADKTPYLTALGAYLVYTADFETYRINGGRVLLSKAAFAAANKDYNEVVYIADVDTSKQDEALFYHVRRAYDQSQYVIFEIEIDMWASFISKASFSKFHIKRCNRELGNGIYNPVKATKGLLFNYYGATLNDSISNYAVVFSAAVVLETGFFGSNPATQTFLFYLPLEDIAAAATSTYQNLDILEKVRFIIGGINSVQAFPTDNKMYALRCWILPKTAAKAGTIGLSSFKTSSVVTGANYTFSNVMVAKCGTYLDTLDFGTILGSSLNAEYPAAHVEFGTRGHTMPLVRYTSNKAVYVRYFVTSCDVRVQVEQGNNIQDISAAFELDININNQTGTSAQELARTGAKILTIMGSTAKAYATGGKGAAVFAAASGILGAQERGGGGSPSSANGDATTTYGLNDADYVMHPFVVAATDSNDDENAIAYYEGAEYDEYNSNFAAIEGCTHLGSVAQGLECVGTFIQSDAFEVAGINAEAENFIREEFGRGIWYKMLQ